MRRSSGQGGTSLPFLSFAYLVEHSPIVEIGAGTGYWAKLGIGDDDE